MTRGNRPRLLAAAIAAALPVVACAGPGREPLPAVGDCVPLRSETLAGRRGDPALVLVDVSPSASGSAARADTLAVLASAVATAVVGKAGQVDVVGFSVSAATMTPLAPVLVNPAAGVDDGDLPAWAARVGCRTTDTARAAIAAADADGGVLHGTDVVGAINRGAARLGGQGTLVVITDGVNNTNGPDLGAPDLAGRLAAGDTAGVAAEMPLADLAGVAVVMVGVGRTNPPGPSRYQESLIAIWADAIAGHGAARVWVGDTLPPDPPS